MVIQMRINNAREFDSGNNDARLLEADGRSRAGEALEAGTVQASSLSVTVLDERAAGFSKGDIVRVTIEKDEDATAAAKKSDAEARRQQSGSAAPAPTVFTPSAVAAGQS